MSMLTADRIRDHATRLGLIPQRAGEPGAAESASGGLSAVGTGPTDGAVADECGRRLPPGRSDRAKAVSGIDDSPGSQCRPH